MGWVVENSQEGLDAGLLQALQDPSRLAAMKKQLAGYSYPNQEIVRQFMEVL